jgi:hypothetical protein
LSIECSTKFCLRECACSLAPPLEGKICHACMQFFCKKLTDKCTGLGDD